MTSPSPSPLSGPADLRSPGSPSDVPPSDASPSAPLPAPLSAPLSVELRSLVVVDARGADAATFLQGQLSNDITGQGAGRACLAGYCNPKGRLLALPVVLTLPDGGLRLLVARELVDSLLQRLRLFVMRADVDFEIRDALRCRALLLPREAVAGAGASAPLAHGVPSLPATPPAEVLDVLGGEEGADTAQILRWHDATAPLPCRRYLIVAAAGAGDEGGGESARAVAASPDDSRYGGLDGDELWRLGDISAGLPRIGAATREAFVPQMVNLQLVGGLSFRKGCYPGQEIVARMQYLGKLKRHMRRFRVAASAGEEADAVLAAGDPVLGDDGAEAGQVVDAVSGESGTELLAVVRIGVATEALRVHGAALEALSLPYELPDGAAGPSGTRQEAEGT